MTHDLHRAALLALIQLFLLLRVSAYQQKLAALFCGKQSKNCIGVIPMIQHLAKQPMV